MANEGVGSCLRSTTVYCVVWMGMSFAFVDIDTCGSYCSVSLILLFCYVPRQRPYFYILFFARGLICLDSIFICIRPVGFRKALATRERSTENVQVHKVQNSFIVLVAWPTCVSGENFGARWAHRIKMEPGDLHTHYVRQRSAHPVRNGCTNCYTERGIDQPLAFSLGTPRTVLNPALLIFCLGWREP